MKHQAIFPAVEMQISTPAELTTLLRSVKQCVADGRLRQVLTSSSPLTNDDLNKIPDKGPWPDYLEAFFEDGCGQRYRLAVETYHGMGGSWGRG